MRLGELLVYRLGELADNLQQSANACAATIERSQAQQQQAGVSSRNGKSSSSSNTSSSSSSNSSRYQPSAEHLQLIQAYCASKAALARQLAAGYPIRMSGVFLG